MGKANSLTGKHSIQQLTKPLTALAALGTSEEISEGVLKEIEKFICQVYKPGSSIDKLAELRWYLFSKKTSSLGKTFPY